MSPGNSVTSQSMTAANSITPASTTPNFSDGSPVLSDAVRAKRPKLEGLTDTILMDDKSEPGDHSDTGESARSNPEAELLRDVEDPEWEWEIEDILKERKGMYLVKWKGIDPSTRLPWKSTWVILSSVHISGSFDSGGLQSSSEANDYDTTGTT
jgi:hypothetical protein